MSIETPEQPVGMREAGRVVRRMLEAMKEFVRAGVTTREIDGVGAAVMGQEQANSAPALVYRFPGTSCISVNGEAVRGIPDDRVIREGDLVKLDVTIEKNGFMADAAETVPVGATSEENRQLMACVRRPLKKPCS